MWTTSTHVTDNETATQLSFINCGGGSTVDPHVLHAMVGT